MVAKLRAAAGVGLLHNRKYKQAARKFCEVSRMAVNDTAQRSPSQAAVP